jgi:hypothetical protein
VLYFQTIPTTGTKSGPQMQALYAMVARAAGLTNDVEGAPGPD